MKVLIYTKDKCPNCTAAKQLLRAKNINYVEMDVEAHPEVLIDLPVRQMPQIFINGQRVGGLAGLQEALKQMENQS
jgi:glutaredoxin 3